MNDEAKLLFRIKHNAVTLIIRAKARRSKGIKTATTTQRGANDSFPLKET